MADARAIGGIVTMLAALASCAIRPPAPAPILLFNGAGTSSEDVAALENILRANNFDYATVNSWQLNRMDEAALRRSRLLIVPGGNFVRIGDGLNASASANIRSAVRDGLNYLGFCAGAFYAGNSPYNGLNLTGGVRFGFYSVINQGVHKTVVAIADAGAPTLDQYWENGPELSGWGAVIGKYPDGTPAVVEGMAGRGWMVLSGVHPEAPAEWRRGLSFHTPMEVDHAYAATLIRAALRGQSMAAW